MTAETNAPHEALTAEILADARRQAERLRRRAEREAQAVRAEAEREAQAEADRRLAEARAEAERRRRLVLASVPVEEGRMRARRIEALLEEVRAEAERRLAGREGFDYREALVRLAAQAVGAMGGGRFVLYLEDEDREAFGADLAEAVRSTVGRPDLAVEVAPGGPPREEWADAGAEAGTGAPPGAGLRGGVLVRDGEGRRQWDNRLSARMRRLWPALRRRLAREAGLVPASETPPPSPTEGPAGPGPAASPKKRGCSGNNTTTMMNRE